MENDRCQTCDARVRVAGSNEEPRYHGPTIDPEDVATARTIVAYLGEVEREMQACGMFADYRELARVAEQRRSLSSILDIIDPAEREVGV